VQEYTVQEYTVQECTERGVLLADAKPADRTVRGYRHGRVPREVRAQQLVDLAEDLFLSKGYEGFSIEELCRLAGVSRPVVYDHFGGKDGIYIACIRRFRDAYDTAIEAAADADDPADVVAAAVGAFFAAIEENPKAWTLFTAGSAIVGPVAEEIDRQRRGGIERIAVLARRLLPGADQERITAAAHFISGGGTSVGQWWLRNPGVPLERLTGYQRDFIMAMLAAEQNRSGC
jgi:AcrR family transcriptional regulator